MELAQYKNKLKALLNSLSKDEIPVGAIIIKNNEVIGLGVNQKESIPDPTAHAEIMAIREASQKANNGYLDEAIIITTLEPCPMCMYAIIEARIKEVIYFCKDEKNGAINSKYEVVSKINSKKIPKLTYEYDQYFKVLLKDFFKKLR